MLKRYAIIAATVASISVGAQASSIDSLKGIEAETLNAVEMQEVQGQIDYATLVSRIKTSKFYSSLKPLQQDRLIAYLAALNQKYPVLLERILAYIK